MFGVSEDHTIGHTLKELVAGKKWKTILMSEPSWTQRALLLKLKPTIFKFLREYQADEPELQRTDEQWKGKILKQLVEGKTWKAIILAENDWAKRVKLLSCKSEIDAMRTTFDQEV